MLTIPKQWPKSARGSNQATCDYCGVPWIRSRMRRDRSGMLACPDDYGRDMVSLDEANAAGAQRRPRDANRDTGSLYAETIEDSETLIVPSRSGVINPFTGSVIPESGVMGSLGPQWLRLLDAGDVRVLPRHGVLDADMIAALWGTSLELHYDAGADVGLVSTDQVDTWTDQAKGFVVTAASSANRGVYNSANDDFNGQPTIQTLRTRQTTLSFTNNDFLVDNGLGYIACVCRQDDLAGGVPFKIQSTVSGARYFEPVFGSTYGFLAAVESQTLSYTGGVADIEPTLFEYWADGTTFNMAVGGVTVNSQTWVGPLAHPFNRFTVGSGYSYNSGGSTTIGEIIVSSYKASSRHLSKYFLSTKYGLGLVP